MSTTAMSEATIAANPAFRAGIRRIGQEATPVVVIDDFALNTSDVIGYACSHADFSPEDTSAYPGIRAALPRSYVMETLNAVFELLYRVYAVPTDLRLRPQNAVYSLVSTQPDDLKLSQRVPHFDSSKPYFFAITHYLNAGAFGGTGFFRHKPTGYENILEDRLARYIRAGEVHIADAGDPAAGYISCSDDHYELYDQVGYRANRLVAYPGSLLHSGLVDPDKDVNADPATGRLTANIFVDFR